MNRAICLLTLGLVSLLLGCGPKEPPPAPKQDAASMQRDWLYGPRAATPGITWQADGLGIRVLASGEGTAPLPTDRVRCHFVCTLKDGKVIDDSRARGQPAEFFVNRLIPGWAEGMAALKPGGRAEFFIPPSLGYGNRGGAGIPAGSGLIFEVELLAVNPEVAPKP